MVDETVSAFGRLDAAFNNAGVQSLATESADATSEEFDRVNAINLRSVWLCMKYELLQMRKQESGICVASHGPAIQHMLYSNGVFADHRPRKEGGETARLLRTLLQQAQSRFRLLPS